MKKPKLHLIDVGIFFLILLCIAASVWVYIWPSEYTLICLLVTLNGCFPAFIQRWLLHKVERIN